MKGQIAAARPLRLVATALGVCLALLAPAGARADTAPAITAGPAIAGVPRESEVLTASATWTGDPEPTVAWRWVRCATPKAKCTAVDGAASQSYQVVAADVGSVLRVRIKLTNSAGTAEARSDPTDTVEPAPPPSPTPDPEEPPTGPPPPPPFDPPANPVNATAPPAGGVAPPMLRPFPIVRIRGWLTRLGARVTLLTVRAPRGVQIAARCRGRSCPVRRFARTTSVTRTRLRPLQRGLRAGTRLDITVRKTGYIGKWTTIVIRRGRPPARADRCVYPGARRPAPCPAG
jgi:hypothetical protein